MDTIRAWFSINLSKLVLYITKKVFNGGSNFPGKIALKIYPNILKKVSDGYDVIFITGTNGKTTTTSMIYNCLKNDGVGVITNATGANMLAGIVTTFVENYKKNNTNTLAIIEVDEANLKFATKYIKPKAIVITNLFRDQLDRYGEVYTTLEKIMEGVTFVKTTLILNGDEPLLGDLNVLNIKKYFGLHLNSTNVVETNVEGKFCVKCKNQYSYNFVSYNHLGDYYCEKCGYKRPEIDFLVEEVLSMNSEKSVLKIDDKILSLNMGGMYNVYNAICAYSVLKFLKVKTDNIFASFEKQESAFGRQESIQIDDKEIKIILVKNPAGYNEALNTLLIEEEKTSIGFMLNDNYADGKDISWIWDVSFEKISKGEFSEIFVGGTRVFDMATRIKIAGFDTKKMKICDKYEILLEKIKECEDTKITILVTYTAMIEFRKFLFNNKYLKKLW